jgi:hypothetical protein
MMTYPLIYMLIWSLPTAVRIYQSTTHKAAPTPVADLDKVRPNIIYNTEFTLYLQRYDRHVLLYRELLMLWFMDIMRDQLRHGAIYSPDWYALDRSQVNQWKGESSEYISHERWRWWLFITRIFLP